MSALAELQQWYLSQCDGDWEHQNGVTIGTLDNPGWSVRIDLAETELSEAEFTEIDRTEHESDWIVCRVRNGKFEAFGGPLMLDELLRAFLTWAAATNKT